MHAVLLLDPKALNAAHLGAARSCCDQQQCYREMQRLVQQTTSLTLFGTFVASLCEENPDGISSVKSVTHSFFSNFFQSHYFVSSAYHYFLPLAAVTVATSTAYPPWCLFLCVSGMDTEHLQQTDLQNEHHATHHGHLSTKMSTGKRYWCHTGNVQQAVLMFIWIMSIRSFGTDHPYQATVGCLAEDIQPITLGPAFLRTSIWDSDGIQVKMRGFTFLLSTHMHFSHQHPELHGLQTDYILLFSLKPWLIFSILFSFFTPTYFLYLNYFSLS